jgi:UDP-N-acetylmuramoylalanine--D-glutamate ligase
MTGERDFLVGKRVTVIGLGIEGEDMARFAAASGAISVSVVDTRSRAALSDRVEALAGLDIAFHLGADSRPDLESTGYLFASQSVLPRDPVLQEARARGIPVDSMTDAFLRLCPGPSIGISGSSGKTTTTSLIAHMLATAGQPHCVGGNIGTGLLALLDRMDDRTWAVVEMSHTQLALVEHSPHIAVLLNVTPNHLDQFSWDEYVELKRQLLRFQADGDHAVLNLDDAVAAASAEVTPARVSHFSMTADIPGSGAFLRDGALFLRRDHIEEMVIPVGDVPLRGAHNVANVLAAVATGALVGLSSGAMAAAIRSFQAVPHRLELVGEVAGVRYVNDSIATTPERTLAGLRSFSEPVVLLLGGKDKDLPKEELAAEALDRCSGIVFFGADGAMMEAAVEAAAASVAFEDRPITARVASLAEAVVAARELAAPGDVVLLSPACTSFDAYPNFEARGEEFRRIVAALQAREG